jgi:DNA gyrase subunit A
MEQEKIHAEMEELKKTIAHLHAILQDESILRQEIVTELTQLKEEYNNPRKSRIEGAIDIFTEADLIPDEEVVVTLTMKGYVKRVGLETYGVQHRGGKGKMGMATLEGSDDVIQDLYVAKNHDELLFFTNFGRVYSMQVFEVPEASRIAKGRAIINLLPLQEGERVVKLLCTRDIAGKFFIMVTKKGITKRTEAAVFAKIRTTGIRAVTLNEGDELAYCAMSSGSDTVVLATANGQGIRFKENEVRVMGRQAAGVIGIRLKKSDYVVGMEVLTDEGDILFATENGYGKRVKPEDFRVAHRGGVGVRTIPTDGRNGHVIGLTLVTDKSNVLLIDKAGKIIRLAPTEIRTMGRQAKGVRLIRLDEGQKLVSVVAFEGEDHEDANTGSGSGEGTLGGAVKLDTEQSVTDILKMGAEVTEIASRPATTDELESFGAADESDDFVAFEQHVEPAILRQAQDERDDAIAQEEITPAEDKGSILEEF